MNSKKKVIFDMLINIVAVAIPTIVLQLYILPQLANYMSSDEYGLIVTILALMNTFPSAIGIVLNNVRLLHQLDYEDTSYPGDVPLLLIYTEIINIIFLTIASFMYLGKGKNLEIFLTVLVGIFWLSKEYHVVAYRLKIDYKAVLINNLLVATGYIVGYEIFKWVGYWQVIYISSIIFSYIYLIKNTDIVFEKPGRGVHFKKCIKDILTLSGSTVLARLINYADKILIYPIMGGTSVTIYYVATLLSKVVSLVITPINSVALTYLTKYKNKPNSIFRWTMISGSIICIIGYFASILLSKPILTFLYPNYASEAIKYIYITSASIVISVFTTIISPFVLKFCDTIWQVVINVITTIIYVGISLLLVNKLGLTGFCIGVLTANVVKLFATLWTYFKHSIDTKQYFN